MKKTIQIYMASTTFTYTEEAYEKLQAYLDELRAHFTDDINRDEVMSDIENRIAEKITERKFSPVTLQNVTTIISEIGEVSHLIEEEQITTKDSQPETIPYKKLYRDSDNSKLAGVASGLGAYFNIEPVLFRIAFIVTFFIGGTGFFTYLLLWILVPKAKTASQKLEMRGQKITLKALKKTIKENGKTISKNSHGIITWFEKIAKKLWYLFTKIFGGLMTVGSFLIIVALTTLLGTIILNWDLPFNDLPFKDSSSLKLLTVFLFASYLSVIIPLVFLTILGIKILLKKKITLGGTTFSFIGLWTVAIIITGITLSTIITDYYTYTENNPNFQQITKTIPLDDLREIQVEDMFINLENGKEAKATLTGRPLSIESVFIKNEDGVLKIKDNGSLKEKVCFFCFNQAAPANITITTPNLSKLKLENGRINFDDFRTDVLEISTNNSRAVGAVEVGKINLSSKNSWSDLMFNTETLNITDSNSHFKFKGKTNSVFLNLKDTSLDITSLEISELDLKAITSEIVMNDIEDSKIDTDKQSHVKIRNQTKEFLD